VVRNRGANIDLPSLVFKHAAEAAGECAIPQLLGCSLSYD
jgi:hypothetical protein